jgi:hypothetical protein
MEIEEIISSEDDRRIDLFHVSTTDSDMNIMEAMNSNKMDLINTFDISLDAINQLKN